MSFHTVTATNGVQNVQVINLQNILPISRLVNRYFELKNERPSKVYNDDLMTDRHCFY